MTGFLRIGPAAPAPPHHGAAPEIGAAAARAGIVGPVPGSGAGPMEAPTDPDAGTDAYLQRLFLLLPAEVISLYPVGLSILAKPDADVPVDTVRQQHLAWTILCVIICVAFRAYGTRDHRHRPEWGSVGIALTSFLIWVYVSKETLFFAVPRGWEVWPSLILIVWVTVVPLFWTGRPATHRRAAKR